MLITHYGHAAFLLQDGATRILIDPGNFSPATADLTNLTAILATHAHADHLDQPVVAALLKQNPAAPLYLDAHSLDELDAIDHTRVISVRPGDTLTIDHLRVDVLGGEHADIYPDIPRTGNVAYLFPQHGFLHPGDSFNAPHTHVRVLALPISGPWQGLAQAVDYLRVVAPDIAIPMHETLLADPSLYIDYIRQLRPTKTQIQSPAIGAPKEV